jgi:hypothetical protein
LDAEAASVHGSMDNGLVGIGALLVPTHYLPGAGEGFGNVVVAVVHCLSEPRIVGG